MGISLVIAIPSIFSSLITFMVFTTTYKAYKRIGIRELFYISLGWLLLLPYFISYAIFEILTGTNYEIVRIYSSGLISLSAVLGLLLLYYMLVTLWGVNPPVRIYLLYSLILIGLPIYIDSIEWNWLNGHWIINYSNNFGLLFVAIPSIWLNTELSILTYRNIRLVKSIIRIHAKAIFTGFTFFNISLVALILERNVFKSDQTNYFILIQAIGALMVSLAIYFNPYSIIPANINSKFLVIVNRQTSEVVLNHVFDEYDIIDKKLFSGTITAILALFEKITDQKSIPKEFGFLNYSIILASYKNFLALYVCNRYSSVIQQLLCPVLEKFEGNQLLEPVESKELEIHLDQIFSFAI